MLVTKKITLKYVRKFAARQIHRQNKYHIIPLRCPRQ